MTLALANESFFQLNRKKVKPQHKELLMMLYKWVLSDNSPISKFVDGKKWFLINYSYIAKTLRTGYMNVRNYFKRLCGDSTNDIPFIYKRIEKCNKKGYLSYAWISINDAVAKQALSEESVEYQRLVNKRNRRKGMSDALFEIEDNRLRFPEEAIAIANHIIYRYNEYFPHKIPSSNTKPSTLYTETLRKITDIYNGSFTNPRVYSLNEAFITNESFDIEGWRDIVKEVKGSWSKVRSLILEALRNFDKMHLPNYMPFSKKYLQNNISLWFYDSFNGQSQFIQCLKEPETISKHIAELKADRIFDDLPENARIAGNRFFDMNKEMGSVTLWDNIRKMTEWARAVFMCDRSSGYWASHYSEIPLKFQQYCEENNIKVTTTTLDIDKAVDYNSPWSWFVQRAIERHRLNNKLDQCRNAEEVYELYDRDIPF